MMDCKLRHAVAAVLMAVFFSIQFVSNTFGADPPVQQFLSEGRLQDGAVAMQSLLEQNPDNQQVRFSLGVVEFLQAIEGLGRDHYRYGLLGERRPQMTFMRLPIPENKNPEQISYQKARTILKDFVDRLTRAEQTLAEMEPGDVKLPLVIGQIRFDFDSDGTGSDEETLWSVIDTLRRPRRNAAAAPATNDFRVTFDAGDVYWLRGYCHAMCGLAEIALAYDWHDQFERTAHLFYPNVDTPYVYLGEEGPGLVSGFDTRNILDVITLIHTINYECTEPKRMLRSLEHFETVISLGRQSWKAFDAETDNDNEWIPNPNQESAAGGMRVGRTMITGWHQFLDEIEAILQGKKLVPFWRGAKGGMPLFLNSARDVAVHPELGINVRRIFTEPTRLDLALWLQGTGLHPYLEKGDRTGSKTWGEITSAFGNEFFLFLFWFN
jgi:hypothetical protein